MKVTNVDLYSNNTNVANFSFRDPGARNPYTLQGLWGLDADEIISKFYGNCLASGVQFYSPSVENRDIVLKIALNPQFRNGKTYSDLRDDLYRVISSSRTGLIELRFKDGDATQASISGYVSKFEAPHFEQNPLVQITIKCDDPTLKAVEVYEVPLEFLGENSSVFDGLSTAPHGIDFSLEFVSAATEFIMKDDETTPSWTFEIVPGILGADPAGFAIGDVLYFSSNKESKEVYIVRGEDTYYLADKVQPNSIWPIVFPRYNTFVVEPGDVDWKYMKYYPTYWGV